MLTVVDSSNQKLGMATVVVVMMMGASHAGRALESTHESQIDIIWWDDGIQRATAIFRMLDAAGLKYKHIWNQEETLIFSSNWYHPEGSPKAASDVFAPPAVREGTLLISQTAAVVTYIGQKAGYDCKFGESSQEWPTLKATQYMADMSDFFEEFLANVRATKRLAAVNIAATTEHPMHIFLEGGRFAAWLGNFERSIRGPFYFGDSPCYVDFLLAQVVDCVEDMALNALQPKIGVLLALYPKVVTVVELLRSLPSYQGYPKYAIPNLPQNPPAVSLDETDVLHYPREAA